MAISINWATQVISIPQADLTYLSPGLYELDVDVLRLALKDIEDGEEGIAFPDTHRHNTEVTLAGVTYARTFEIINGYTVTFQDTGSPYTVKCVGANHNIGDVKNVNQVSLIVGNSAGLITVNTSGAAAGLTAGQEAKLNDLWTFLGLDSTDPVTIAPTGHTSVLVEVGITDNGDGSVTLQRA